MAGIPDGLFDVCALVEGSVVHDESGPRRELRHQVLHQPGMEDVGGDVGLEQADGEQRGSRQGTDGVDAASCVPVARSGAALTSGRIAVGAGHVPGEAAFVDVDDRPALSLDPGDPLAKGAPFAVVRLRMAQRFFYM